MKYETSIIKTRVNKLKPLSIYVHIPFCLSKCAYCHFYSLPQKKWDIETHDKYVAKICKEIAKAQIESADYLVETIYFGGGTPTTLSIANIKSIVSSIKSKFNLVNSPEISIEVNPGTVNAAYLKKLYELGFNRISIGAQAYQDRLLKMMGRVHDMNDTVHTMKWAIEAGFQNINIDLIFGYPTQTMQEWKETIEYFSTAPITHISCYSLEIHEKTPLRKSLTNNELNLPNDSLDRQMYHYASRSLTKKGFEHYEISNFAKPGYQCVHNLNFWEGKEYLGIGDSAESYFREHNRTKSKAQQINKLMTRYVILHLRLIKSGINYDEFMKMFEVDFNERYKSAVTKLISNRLIRATKSKLVLTTKGMDLLSLVEQEFVTN